MTWEEDLEAEAFSQRHGPLCYRDLPTNFDHAAAFIERDDGSFVSIEEATARQLIRTIQMERAAADWHIARGRQLQKVFKDLIRP